MAQYDPRGPVVGTPTERIVRLPDASTRPEPETVIVEERPPVVIEDRPAVLTRSRAPWLIAFGLFLVAALALFLVIFAPDGTTPGTTPGRTVVDGAEAPLSPLEGSGLALPAPDTMRTHTLNVAGDQDLLAMSQAGLGSVARFEGAPVTADGVTVGTAYTETVFTVTSPAGGEMAVLVPYTTATRDLLILAENEHITFNGTLLPTSPDDAETLGGAYSVATHSGAYVLAVPESIRVIPASDDTLVS